ncbi:MAG: methyltransferase domain-containing protein [Planctomycetaceae bacterium]
MSDISADVPEEHFLGQFIPLHYHFNMLRDQQRMLPFREAIDLTVPEGGVVLELGGGTGVLSWFAAQQASRVYCVERNPALARAAQSFLACNPRGDRVSVVLADAMNYLPPEPVDVVICEMLHVGMVREKQLEVLHRFKERYRQRFGPTMPRFIPDTSVLALQPIQQDFNFSGYIAKVPIFEPPGPHMKDSWLADPFFYSTIDYNAEIPLEFRISADLTIQVDGEFNAISLLTNNFLAFVLHEKRAVTWLMNQLVLPLTQPIPVTAGDVVSVKLTYRAGGTIESLHESLITRLATQTTDIQTHPRLRRAA